MRFIFECFISYIDSLQCFEFLAILYSIHFLNLIIFYCWLVNCYHIIKAISEMRTLYFICSYQTLNFHNQLMKILMDTHEFSNILILILLIFNSQFFSLKISLFRNQHQYFHIFILQFTYLWLFNVHYTFLNFIIWITNYFLLGQNIRC